MSDTSKSSATIVLIRGLPGSGKSYLAGKLMDLIAPSSVISLDPDQIDYDSSDYKLHSVGQLSEGVDEKLLPYRYLRSKAYLGIQEHKIVVWNQPFTDLDIFKKMIGRLTDYAERRDIKLRVLVVEIITDAKVAKDRVLSRRAKGGHGPSDQRFRKFLSDYAAADPSEYEVIQVNGDGSVSDAAEKILNKLNK